MLSSSDNSETTEKAVGKPPSEPNRFVQTARSVVARLKVSGKNAYQHLSRKGLNYWLIVAFLIPGSMLLGDYISEHRMFIGPRYWIYHTLQRWTPRTPTYSTHTVVVTIDDDEYWKGKDLARRIPLKKDYLIRLIDQLVKANTTVIAIDVDLRTQTPDGSPVYPDDYKKENEDFVAKIREVSEMTDKPTHIILPRTIGSLGSDAAVLSNELRYVQMPSIYARDFYKFNSAKVHEAFVALPYDIRQVPLILPIEGRSDPLYSFAAAAVKIKDPQWLLNARVNDPLPYGIFLDRDSLTTLRASEVLADSPPALQTKIANRVVLIGGTWHQDAYREGDVVDTHYTPVGDIEGVFVHANYMEALLTHWSSSSLGQRTTVAIEFILTVFIALVFAWDMRPLKTTIWVLVLSLLLILITCFLWQNLGMFFDFSIPLLLLGAHYIVDKVWEWRRDARKYRSAKEKKQQAPLTAEPVEGAV